MRLTHHPLGREWLGSRAFSRLCCPWPRASHLVDFTLLWITVTLHGSYSCFPPLPGVLRCVCRLDSLLSFFLPSLLGTLSGTLRYSHRLCGRLPPRFQALRLSGPWRLASRMPRMCSVGPRYGLSLVTAAGWLAGLPGPLARWSCQTVFRLSASLLLPPVISGIARRYPLLPDYYSLDLRL